MSGPPVSAGSGENTSDGQGWAVAAQAAGHISGTVIDVLNADRNFKAQQEQQSYMRDLQQTMFNREDNAVQRRVADLRAAGLSPVLAAGQAAQSGPVVQSSAPQADYSGVSDKVSKIGSSGLDALAVQQMKANIGKTNAETAWVVQQARQSAELQPDRAGSLSETVRGQKLGNIFAELTQGDRVQQAKNANDSGQLDILSRVLGIKGQEFSNAEAEVRLNLARQLSPSQLNSGNYDALIKSLTIARMVADNSVYMNQHQAELAGVAKGVIDNILDTASKIRSIIGNQK